MEKISARTNIYVTSVLGQTAVFNTVNRVTNTEAYRPSDVLAVLQRERSKIKCTEESFSAREQTYNQEETFKI